jgi:hypothetical protein
VLTERSAEGWEYLDRSASPAGSYHQAMADGLLALQALVPDLDVGPRTLGESAPAREKPSAPEKDAGSAAQEHKSGTNSTPAVGKSYFGFGPAR